MSEFKERGHCFVIYSRSRGSIWDKPFLTREDAEAELKFQMATIPEKDQQFLDWHVKQMPKS